MGEPIPPTVRDRPRSLRWLGVPLLVGLAVAAYFLFWHHEAIAHRHVPEGTRLVLRADAQALATFRPMREHLWPYFFRAPADQPSERLERIEAATGIRIPLDLREAVVASVDAESWVLIVGGPIEPGRFVTGMEAVLGEEGAEGWRREGPLLVHRLGPALGQADDGTIVVGTGAPIVEACLPAHEGGDLPVPVRGAMSFAVHEDAYEGALDRLPSFANLETLGRIRSLSGALDLDDTPELSVAFVPAEGVDPEALRKDLDRDLGRVSSVLSLVSYDLYGVDEALSARQLSLDEQGLRLVAPWPYEALDRAVSRLADALARGKPPSE